MSLRMVSRQFPTPHIPARAIAYRMSDGLGSLLVYPAMHQ